MLDLAAQNIRSPGAMARAIRARFGWSTTRYYQRLDRIVRSPEGIAHDTITCRRMRELADSATP